MRQQRPRASRRLSLRERALSGGRTHEIKAFPATEPAKTGQSVRRVAEVRVEAVNVWIVKETFEPVQSQVHVGNTTTLALA